MDLKEICIKLDNVLVDFFSKVKQLYQEQHILEQYMKDGYLNMSRARYNMGVKAVGIQQLDENSMKALSKVNIEDSESVKGDLFKLSSSVVPPITTSNNSKPIENIGLRKRNTGSENVEKSENIKYAIDENVDTDDTPVDPIKWFGVLVSQNLRKSQCSFKQAVETTVTIANLQTNIISLKTEYKSLLEKKSMLLKAKVAEN